MVRGRLAPLSEATYPTSHAATGLPKTPGLAAGQRHCTVPLVCKRHIGDVNGCLLKFLLCPLFRLAVSAVTPEMSSYKQ